MQGVKVDMVPFSEMEKDKNASVIGQSEMSIDAIPDLDVLTGHVFEILQYLEDPSSKKLMKTKNGEGAIRMHLNNKYADSVPLGIITLLMDENNREENVKRLLNMFNNLVKAKEGKESLTNLEKQLTDDVNERYLYSKYGSKEAFEKALAKEVKKEGLKKTKNGQEVKSLKNIGKLVINE